MLEATNEPYAIAKIAGITLRELQPPVRARLPQRDADQPVRPERQLPPREQPRHPGAVAALPRGGAQRRRRVVIWAAARQREFLHVDDMAAASVHVMELNAQTEPTPSRCSRTSTSAAGGLQHPRAGRNPRAGHRVPWPADVRRQQADGTPRKLMDVSRLKALARQHRLRTGCATPTAGSSSIAARHGVNHAA